MKCIRAIKAKIINKKSLIIFISVVILFAIAIIIIAVNNCCWVKTTNAIITLVGIVLAFISILLSYKGLMLTKEVKEDIALQQFKIKQQEVVDKLVYLLNVRTYDILLQVNNNGYNTNAYIKANLYGIVGLYNSTEYDMTIFNKCPVLDEEVGVLLFANEYIANPYLPISISSSLARLLQNDNQKYKTKNPNDKVVFSEIRETQKTIPLEYNDQEQVNKTKVYSDWGTWVEDVDSLFANIREWYNKEHHNVEPNLLMLKKVVSYYPSKK